MYPHGDRKQAEKLRQLSWRYTAFGIELSAAFLAPVLLGAWLGERLGCAAALTLTGLVVGAGASARCVQRLVKRVQPRKRGQPSTAAADQAATPGPLEPQAKMSTDAGRKDHVG